VDWLSILELIESDGARAHGATSFTAEPTRPGAV